MPLLHLPTKAAGNYGFCPHILSICSQFSYAVEHALKARLVLATEYSYILSWCIDQLYSDVLPVHRGITLMTLMTNEAKSTANWPERVTKAKINPYTPQTLVNFATVT